MTTYYESDLCDEPMGLDLKFVKTHELVDQTDKKFRRVINEYET